MSALRLVIAALCLAALCIAAVCSWAPRIPDLELRNQPWRTHLGVVDGTYPVGERFQCENDGLHAIDVAVTRSGPATGAQYDFVLRELGSAPRELRRARVAIDSVPPSGAFLRFDFAPVVDSGGKSYAFELTPVSTTPRAQLVPYVVYRGQAQDVNPWGDHAAKPSELEGTFVCEHPDLRAIAIGITAFDPSAGGAELELSVAGSDGPPLVTARLSPRATIENGWAFFPMPVVHDSRWKTLRYRLTLPKGASASAGRNGLAMISYHGSGIVSARLGGMTVRGEAQNDRDLVFRAWSAGGTARLWPLLHERGGATVVLAACLWIATSIAMLALVRRTARLES